MTTLTFDPYISPGLWTALALTAAVLWAGYVLGTRRRLPWGRWVAVSAFSALMVAMPLVLLLNPTWVRRVAPPGGRPLLNVLVDRSASMATPDEHGASRHEAASEIAQRLAQQLRDRYDVRLRSFAVSSSIVLADDLAVEKADGTSTDLAAAIDDALEEERAAGQALVLLSDGVHNAEGGVRRLHESVARARAMAAPVMTKLIGGQASVKDIELQLDLPEELAFIGQRLPVTVTLQQRGDLGRNTRLSLLEDGKPVESRELEIFPDGISHASFFVVQEKPGLYRYEFQVEPIPGEATTVNNTGTLLLRVIDEPIQVLLLEGKPYWDTKFLTRTLAGDKSVRLRSVVRLTESRYLERTFTSVDMAKAEEAVSGDSPSPPASDAEPDGAGAGSTPSSGDTWTVRADAGAYLDNKMLHETQVVVLGRDAEAFLTDDALVRLEKWLQESGGSLVCFRGAPSSQIGQRLGKLMPLRWTPGSESHFRMQWTEAGRAMRWLPTADDDAVLPCLPSLSVAARAGSPQPLAVVLARSSEAQGDGVPVLAYQRMGNGRVVVVEGAGMWRWAFLAPQYQAHDEIYGFLWRSLVRWLVSNVGLLPSQRVALRTDKVTFRATESVSAELFLRPEAFPDGAPQVELRGDSMPKTRRVAPQPSGDFPGYFRVPLGRLPQGRYWLRVVDAAEDEVSAVTAFDVRDHLRERLEVQARPDVMRFIAEQSGGSVLDEVDAEDLAKRFDQHLARSQPDRVVRTIAWDKWWVLAGVLGLFVVTWGVSRRSGLV